MITADTLRIHVRFNGRSEDLDLEALGLSSEPSDSDLFTALACRYECGVSALSDYLIVREPQAIIVRPIAYYG